MNVIVNKRPETKLKRRANETIEEKAYQRWWQRTYRYQTSDLSIDPFLKLPASDNGQLRRAREALLKPRGTKDFSRHRFLKLEKSEAKGSITLKALARAADALDCELVYAIRPKSKKRYSRVIWDQILPEVTSAWWFTSRPEHAKHLALAPAAIRIFCRRKYRRIQAPALACASRSPYAIPPCCAYTRSAVVTADRRRRRASPHLA
jgi:hypothetical protein